MFDIETLKPLYELRIGEPGNSNAIAIASRLGMPKKIVMRAERSLASRQRALQRAIAGTLASRRQAERARRDAEHARQDAARQTLAALDQTKALEAEREAYKIWVDRILRLQPGDAVRVKGFDDPGKVARVRHERQRASVSIGAMEVEVPLIDLIFES
jgi:DNA mismatch repair protein MutS2